MTNSDVLARRFGDLVKERRQRRNLTQKDVGDMVGVTQSAVSQWEKGEAVPSLPAVLAVMHYLDIACHELRSMWEPAA